MEISHVFLYKGYTGKQRFIQWGWYMLRFLVDIIAGLVGILTLGFVVIYWGVDISQIILLNQMKFYKEKHGK
jgi:hypothetical protein